MMKSRIFLAIVVAGLFLTSCHFTYRAKADEIAVPLIRALQDNEASEAFCLIPTKDVIDEVVTNNAGIMGNPYYNKYATDYRTETLKAKITADFDIANTITKKDGLDWSKVEIGNTNTEEMSVDGATFNRVTVNLRFGNTEYMLAYNAVKSESRGWFLGNDVYFGKPIVNVKK